MESDCRGLLVDRIRQSGPITVAEYMEVALYAPGAGYYARAVQRSGRAGDFVTSVDVGPLFGELLAVQIVELWHQLLPENGAGSIRRDLSGAGAGNHRVSLPGGGAEVAGCQLVEVGAGNGRLSRDILDALSRRDPSLYDAIQLRLVERSAAARGAQADVLGPHARKLTSSSSGLPDIGAGVLVANELLDAFPVHLVVMTPAGLAEVYIDVDGGSLVERLGPPSTTKLTRYLEDLGVTLHSGARVDVNLAAVDWIRDAARSLARGFVILIDYGYEARTMYDQPNAVTTLTAFARHMADPPSETGSGRTPSWLVAPGTRDLTTHVDFTTLRREAERAGLSTLMFKSQSRFLLDLVERSGLITDLERPDRMRDRLALKSLLVPGGLGSSHSVLVFGKNVDSNIVCFS